MKPVQFEGANAIIGGEIPAHQAYGVTLTRWKGCWRERLKFLLHGTLTVSVIGNTMPPILITSDKAFEITNPPRDLVRV
jgi:hypothetical protein